MRQFSQVPISPNGAAEVRHGVTLTEVLVAIFIMGIGLLSLLTLFPLGALQMAQAIHDDRCTHAAINARAMANMVVPYTPGASKYTLKDDPYTVFPYYAMAAYNPLYAYAPPNTPAGYIVPPPDDGPSYAVYIDPIGVKLTAGTPPATLPPNAPAPAPPWVINNPAGATVGKLGSYPGFPRVCPSFIDVNSFQALGRWCMMPDDLQFVENGTPNLTTVQIQRERRYSWAWLCRQVRRNDKQAPTPLGVDMTVVVYDRRPMAAGPNGAPMGETTYPAQFNYGNNVARLTWAAGAAPPNVRKGIWILDATMLTPNKAPNLAAPLPPTDGGGNNGKPNGYFYRVVNSAVDFNARVATVELHMNARASSGPPADAGGFGIAVVMEGVAEVYERGPTTPQ